MSPVICRALRHPRNTSTPETLRPLEFGGEPVDVAVREQRQVSCALQCRIDANDLCIGLAIGQAWIAVKGIASNAGRMRQRFAVLLVEQDADRQMKRMMAFSLEPVEQLLDARLVGERRISVRLSSTAARSGLLRAARERGRVLRRPGNRARTRRISAATPGKFRPDAVIRFEVAFSQPQQNGAIDLAVAADKIVKAGMKAFAVGTVPGLASSDIAHP